MPIKGRIADQKKEKDMSNLTGTQRFTTNKALTDALVLTGFAVVALYLGKQVSEEGALIVLKMALYGLGGIGTVIGVIMAAGVLVYRAGTLIKRRPPEKLQRATTMAPPLVLGVGLIVTFAVLPKVPMPGKLYGLLGIVAALLLALAAMAFMAGMRSNFAEEYRSRVMAELERIRQKNSED